MIFAWIFQIYTKCIDIWIYQLVKMTPFQLHGHTLGERHRNYNAHFKNIIEENCGSPLEKINNDDIDINNFLKIDLACHNRNVNYVLDIYKCEDTLYVSRAIKRSTWLIKDNQYENIINPDYLHTQLFPHMTSKAKCKLLLSIRLNLRGESRVETFFNYIKKDSIYNALKWLPHCSAPFIEKVLDDHSDIINPSLIKRLCEKSFKYLGMIILKFYWNSIRNLEYDLEATKLLMHTDPEKYMDIILNVRNFFIPKLGARATKTAMKYCPEKVSNSFHKLSRYIHVPTFIKYYKHKELKDFLIEQLKNEPFRKKLIYYISIFKKYLPLEHRIQIVEIFTTFQKQPLSVKNITEYDMDELLCKCVEASISPLANIVPGVGYKWYTLLPFEIAFPKVKSIIHTESLGRSRNNLLKILICCAGNNLKNIESVLEYYSDKHINEALVFKIHFLNNIISLTTCTHKLSSKSWKILNNLFYSVGIYEDSDETLQNCVDCVLVYNILHGITVPEIIKRNINMCSISIYKNKLNKSEQETIFDFLYNYLLVQLQKRDITNEIQFHNSVQILESILNLLNDWDKELSHYTILLEKIKEYIKINKSESWNYNLSNLYNIKKSWKKYMFEESFDLCPSDELCVYVLKHDPTFLDRHRWGILALLFDDNYNKLNSLKRTLQKLRTYWPLSLGPEWAESLQGRFNTPYAHKAVKGLCVLLSSDQLIQFINKYIPVESKINVDETINSTLCLQKQIAMNMYISRPPLSLEIILWYSKGDYVHYARPSLDAMLSNMSPVKSKEIISILLKSTRVSLQKYGIKLAADKLNSEDVKPLMYNTWICTNNMSVRNFIFKKVFNVLIKEKDIEMWKLLSYFIDDLSKSNIGSSTISYTLKKCYLVPIDIKVNFYMKSYVYMSSLPFDLIGVKNLELLKSHINQIISLHLLCAKDEEAQMQAYKNVLIPIMDNYNLNELTNCIIGDLHKYIGISSTIPFKIFVAIQSELENKLSVDKNYILLTKWNLTTGFLKTLADYVYNTVDDNVTTSDPNKHLIQASLVDIFNSSEKKNKWKDICEIMIPLFKDIIEQYLKQQIEKYSPSIYTLFSSALNSTIETLRFERRTLLLKNLLLNENTFMNLVVLQMITIIDETSECQEDTEIREKILSQLPPEQKVYYYNKFKHNKK
ncbi:uncharacterized protein LOC131845477 [Achroia grisella]|uniref:uncharacterized protein LOC131845477 n=1 Tax=Achroia grisella TaxID=688607 RepID=UPI0027D2BCBC|nr:uncharacterized protein LOC131845477 [Achroia grisella]